MHKRTQPRRYERGDRGERSLLVVIQGGAAREIHLVETLEEAYELLDRYPRWLAMGENRGRRPARFTLSNSPVHASRADLDGRTIVQRTSAGTRGALAARRAQPLLCASLAAAEHIELLRRATLDHCSAADVAAPAAETIRRVATSPDAIHTLDLGEDHVHPDDIEHCVDIDRFAFAMQADRIADSLVLRAIEP